MSTSDRRLCYAVDATDPEFKTIFGNAMTQADALSRYEGKGNGEAARKARERLAVALVCLGKYFMEYSFTTRLNRKC